ncbi:TRAP transporter small permease [Propionivibrio dicarboxylicus]|uniref:TRAP transporter small permease protein n=1 Tax=Propionivibrio dicarboxylicus TaxID=83767 RepID=A0A1G8EBG5_9RHOO|nr:TRAP transporter small permease [Propionivibrio dicarboxylicus]SDH67060.1 TRAP-type C4-dicarboxylate transport system, small permease component [Propionivibrio dicarboxylicus]
MKEGLHAVRSGFYRLLEVILVISMVVMFVLVFLNVMLRIFFNTGIDFAEEIPRFAFIWMTFVGAVIGMNKHTHLGVDMVVAALPVFGRKVCWGISQAIMTVCSLYMLYGTWMQHEIIASNASPVLQLSMLWVYGVSYLTGTAITIICLSNIVRLLLGQVDESELIDVQEEGMEEAHEIEKEMAEHASHGGNKA